jgi:hypothetical protein
MPRYVALAPCLALFTALFAASPASATQVFHVPLEQMARESDVVVHARVTGQRTEWDKNHGRILTLTSLVVLDSVKGAKKGDTLTIYQVGGTIDRITTYIPGALQFHKDEEMVFFAMRFRDQIVSYGMGLGKYGIFQKDGTPYVSPLYGSVSWVEHTPKGWKPAAPPTASAEPLSGFLKRVRASLGGAR